VEASLSNRWDVICWRQSIATGETLREKVVVRQFAWANTRIVAGADPELDTPNTENNSEMKNDRDERTLHRMAKVHNVLVMWQGSQNICATQKESCTWNKKMTAIEYILDPEGMVKASRSLFQHDGAAAFKLSERSPLPPPSAAKDLPGGRTQIWNFRQIWETNRDPVEIDEDSTPECISDTEDWLNWNGDLDNPNDSEDDCVADFESDIEEDNSIEDPECPEQWGVSDVPNVPGLIQPTRKSRRRVEQVMMTVNAIETRRNTGRKKK